MDPGEADVLRRALVKQRWSDIYSFGHRFHQHAKQQGRTHEEIQVVWDHLCGFCGYAFCKAHGAAYGVEAYQSAWLKLHYPAEFMAAVLTQGKGFYSPLVYVLESHQLGVKMLPPSIHEPGLHFQPTTNGIRVPLRCISDLSHETQKRIRVARANAPFHTLDDFFTRTRPAPADVDILLRAGALDSFNASRTQLFWKTRWLLASQSNRKDRRFGVPTSPLPLDQMETRSPDIPLTEPSDHDKLLMETELLGYPVSDHPLALYRDIDWDAYCPIARLQQYRGKRVTCCGLVIQERVAQQVNGEPMKFMSIADWTGIIETELFADIYKRFGLTAARHPVLAITATVMPFENRLGHTLRVHHVCEPTRRTK